MPKTSSCFVLGLTSRQIYSFSSSNRCSIGLTLRSGDSAGVFHQLTLLLSRKLLAWIEECLGLLFCIKRCSFLSKFTSPINGGSVFSIIYINKQEPVHDSVKDAYLCSSSLAYACPQAYFYGMLLSNYKVKCVEKSELKSILIYINFTKHTLIHIGLDYTVSYCTWTMYLSALTVLLVSLLYWFI